VTVYTYGKQGEPTVHEIGNKNQLHEEACRPFSDTEKGRLIFLRGYQPPEWLNIIGHRYQIDHEFFRRHLDFDTTNTSPAFFSTPMLASNFDNMLQVSVTTLGFRLAGDDAISTAQQEKLRKLRKNCTTRLQEDLKSQFSDQNCDSRQGESVVRGLTIHGREDFSLEQDISLYVGETDGGWIGKTSSFGFEEYVLTPWSSPRLVRFW
jgi:hypothetical protein